MRWRFSRDNIFISNGQFGVHKVVPLKENGEKIIVDQENRKEFVQLSAQYRLFTSIKEQIESLLEGFYDIIPRELISIVSSARDILGVFADVGWQFNEQEVELLISGTPDIDIDEWRAATDYNGYSPSDPAIVWWWRALKSFDREDRAKVLSFATGTSRVPLDGFGDLQGVQGTQRFSIHRAYGDSDRLPQAHTCFNQSECDGVGGAGGTNALQSTCRSTLRTKRCGRSCCLRSTRGERALGLRESCMHIYGSG